MLLLTLEAHCSTRKCLIKSSPYQLGVEQQAPTFCWASLLRFFCMPQYSLSEGKTCINVYRLILWFRVLWKMLNMLHQALFWIKMWKEKYVVDQDHHKIGYKSSRKHLWTIWINISVVCSLSKPLLSTLSLNNDRVCYTHVYDEHYTYLCVIEAGKKLQTCNP